MEVGIDFTKSAQQNAEQYYKTSKRLAAKREGAERAIKDLERELSRAMEKQQSSELEGRRKVVKKTERQWYEKFHWFFTSSDMLAIGGRDAQQNELINSRHFSDSDLFFHADIFGASAVVLKDGAEAGRGIREEVAQFAACYSSAWEEGLHSVDVYAMRRDQVSKSTGKGSLGTGSFLLSGERDWYRGVQLSLVAFVKDERLNVVPASAFARLKMEAKHVAITLGNYKKSDAAKKIAAQLGYGDIDEIIRQLPSGSFRIAAGGV
jgi:predicted ribosome quality control (RQC) complex YloA/Tae2 family protein